MNTELKVKMEEIIKALESNGIEAIQQSSIKNGIKVYGIAIGSDTVKPIINEFFINTHSFDEIVDYANMLLSSNNSPFEDTVLFNFIKNDAINHLHLGIQKKNDFNNIVTRDYLDLELFVYIDVSSIAANSTSLAVIRVNSNLLNTIDISEDELFERAFKNMNTSYYEFEIPLEMLFANNADKFSMFVAKDNSPYGATAITDLSLIRKFADEFELDEFAIIPSSTEEILFLPSGNIQNYEELNQMIKSVNESEVDAINQLSDHAYFYNREKDAIIWPTETLETAVIRPVSYESN